MENKLEKLAKECYSLDHSNFDHKRFAEMIIQESVDFLSQAACDYEAEMLRSYWDES